MVLRYWKYFLLFVKIVKSVISVNDYFWNDKILKCFISFFFIGVLGFVLFG